ncbi:uncharacterized protein LOC120416077 [Culex pipiens pallens]|uniref:uncharacterized protein LOC120416077 n=1 Tax=Culex pipiens pallens TaxID=42434 RepID=UPI0019540D54|nr:uncharacterized protein LOC120416077 [Culex pipiens pallens]
MVWSRPDQPPIPTIYHTFRAKDVDSDQLVTYRVQDFTEDRHADVIQHYKENFVDDEPLAASRKISSSAVAMAEIVAFWSWCLEQRMTVVCYKEGSDEIVGVNLLHVATPGKHKQWKLESEDLWNTFEAHIYVGQQFNVFERFGVDRYLTAYGLAVNRRYRGRGIATELLKARIPMCKAFGIELTATNFTAVGSQLAAAKAGFKTDFEIMYDDFAKMGPKYVFPGIQTKSLKLMSLKIE